MNYSPEEWDALTAEVERQGGALLPDECKGRYVSFTVKNSDRVTKAKTCGCGNESMAVTIYDPHRNPKVAKKMRERGAGFARICLVCDSVGAWPNFAHVIDREDEEDADD